MDYKGIYRNCQPAFTSENLEEMVPGRASLDDQFIIYDPHTTISNEETFLLEHSEVLLELLEHLFLLYYLVVL